MLCAYRTTIKSEIAAGSDRLSHLVDLDSQKLAAAVVLLSPYVPLLFMGQEYGETARFHYFIDHADRGLCKAVHRGRIAEFIRHAWQEVPPHPKALRTFEASRLNHALKRADHHAELWSYYRQLLTLRREFPVIREPHRDHTDVICDVPKQVLFAHRWNEDQEIVVYMNFSESPVSIMLPRTKSLGIWQPIFGSFNSEDTTVPRRSVCLFTAHA